MHLEVRNKTLKLTFCLNEQGLIVAKLPPSNADQTQFKAPSSPHFTGIFICFMSDEQTYNDLMHCFVWKNPIGGM